MRPALLLGLLKDDLSRLELLCLAGGGTDADVAVDLHCVDRRELTDLCDARCVG